MDANQEQPAVNFDDLPDDVRYNAILQRGVPGLIAMAATLKQKIDIKSVPLLVRRYVTTPIPLEVFYALVYLLEQATDAARKAEQAADKVAGA